MPETEENINFDEVKDIDENEQDLELEDLTFEFVAHPKVGEETEAMYVKRFYKTEDVDRVTKEGEAFSLALKTKKGKGKYAFILDTNKGSYTVSSWEEYRKIVDICKKLGKTKDFKVSIKHLANGMTDKKAQKENRCYEVTLVE